MKNDFPHVSFEVTPVCNLNCRYCYNHWKGEGGVAPIPGTFKQNKRTLRKLLKVADVKQITFTGGEPLMSERFLELVLYARMKGLLVSVISNGTYAGREDYEQLVKLGTSLFELPVHSSNSETHDYLTNHKGSWEKSVATIEQLLELNADVVAVIVLTKRNCSDIQETLDYIYSIGIRRVMVNRVNLGGEGIRNMDELLMSRAELNEAYRGIALKVRELKLVVSSNVCTPICILDPKDFRGIRFTSCSSDFSSRPVTVDHTGNLRFCNHSPVIIGNIFETSIEEIIQSEYVKEWEATPEYCSGCDAYEKCKGGCRAASEQMGLGLGAVDPIVDIIARKSAETRKGLAGLV